MREGFRGEVPEIGGTQLDATPEAVNQIRQQLNEALQLQAEQIRKLQEGLALLQKQQQRLEQAVSQLLEPFATGADGAPSSSTLKNILSSLGNLTKTTGARQVFETLADETARMKVRCAIFDVRGKAVWGSAASGFGAELSPEALQSLVVSLTRGGPFAEVLETADFVQADTEQLASHYDLLEKFKLASGRRVLLFPIRSSGSVTAILYADSSEDTVFIPADPLKILSEFAGAQLDRLAALGGGLTTPSAPAKNEPAVEESVSTAKSETAAQEAPEFSTRTGDAVLAAAEVSPEPAEEAVAAPAMPEPAVAEPPPASAASATEQSSVAPPLASPAAGPAQPSENDHQVHRDAKRFSKLLVSEIELYNKVKVEEGRKNKDLYRRLKMDIDRSRQTYEKRFGNTVARQVDYFHEELVRILAGNDPALLGADYPGPSA